jgi:hypothetical protein
MGFSKIGSGELFVQAGFELQSSLSLPPELLDYSLAWIIFLKRKLTFSL